MPRREIVELVLHAKPSFSAMVHCEARGWSLRRIACWGNIGIMVVWNCGMSREKVVEPGKPTFYEWRNAVELYWNATRNISFMLFLLQIQRRHLHEIQVAWLWVVNAFCYCLKCPWFCSKIVPVLDHMCPMIGWTIYCFSFILELKLSLVLNGCRGRSIQRKRWFTTWILVRF